MHVNSAASCCSTVGGNADTAMLPWVQSCNAHLQASSALPRSPVPVKRAGRPPPPPPPHLHLSLQPKLVLYFLCPVISLEIACTCKMQRVAVNVNELSAVASRQHRHLASDAFSEAVPIMLTLRLR